MTEFEDAVEAQLEGIYEASKPKSRPDPDIRVRAERDFQSACNETASFLCGRAKYKLGAFMLVPDPDSRRGKKARRPWHDTNAALPVGLGWILGSSLHSDSFFLTDTGRGYHLERPRDSGVGMNWVVSRDGSGVEGSSVRNFHTFVPWHARSVLKGMREGLMLAQLRADTNDRFVHRAVVHCNDRRVGYGWLAGVKKDCLEGWGDVALERFGEGPLVPTVASSLVVSSIDGLALVYTKASDGDLDVKVLTPIRAWLAIACAQLLAAQYR